MAHASAQRLATPLMTAAAAAASAAIAWAAVQQEDLSFGGIAVGVLGVGALVVSIRRPEAGALMLLCLMMLLPRETLFEDGVPGLGGQVKVTDLLLGVTVASWVVRRELHLDGRRLPSPGIMALLAVVAVAAVASIATARGRGTPLDLSLQELRPLLAYLLVLPIVGSTRDMGDVLKGLRIALLVAVASSVATMVRYTTAGRPEGGGSYGDLVRVLDDAFLAPLFAVTWAVVLFAFARTTRERMLLVGAAGTGLGGLFLTFQRGAWVATVAAVLVILALLSSHARARVALAICGIALVAGAAALLAGANSAKEGVASPGAAAITRLESIALFEDDPSAQHRLAEWSRAAELIREHPVTGIGLGSGITFYSPLYRVRSDAIRGGFVTYYIHNSYLWFALKIGILGAVAFFALVAATTWRGLRAYRSTLNPQKRALLLGALAGIASLLVLSITGPHLNFDRSTTYAAVLIGVIQVVPGLPYGRGRDLVRDPVSGPPVAVAGAHP